MTAKAVCDLVGIDRGNLHGYPEAVATQVASLDDVGPEGLAFCTGKGTNAQTRMASSSAAILIAEAEPDGGVRAGRAVICVDSARDSFGAVLAAVFGDTVTPEISPSALIDESTVIGSDVGIGAFSEIGANVTIGDRTRIGPRVTVGDGTLIGNDVRIMAGSVIGVVGQGYFTTADGVMERFPHLGAVIIGDDVHIGANCVVVRGMLTDTRIEKQAKLSQMVNVGHNVSVGPKAFIGPRVTLCGSVRTGANVTIGAGATINNNVVISDKATIGLGSVVTKNVSEGTGVFGNPARPVRTMR